MPYRCPMEPDRARNSAITMLLTLFFQVCHESGQCLESSHNYASHCLFVQVCHGTGQSLESSHNNAAHNALKTLAANGLDDINKDTPSANITGLNFIYLYQRQHS